MTERGWIGRRVDRRRERKADITRIHDKTEAEIMAYAERSFRDKARQHEQIGRALVELSRKNYSGIHDDVITPSDVAATLDITMPTTLLAEDITAGIRAYAEHIRTKTVHTHRGAEKQAKEVTTILRTMSGSLPLEFAKNVGFELMSTVAPAIVLSGQKVADQLSQDYRASQARVENSAA